MRQLDLFTIKEKTMLAEEEQQQIALPDIIYTPDQDDGMINFTATTLEASGEQNNALSEKPVERKFASIDRGKISLNKRGRKSYKEIDAELVYVEVPDDTMLFQKQYYSISEVAKWFNVNTSLLRFWETEFDILKPRKNRKGDRLFRPEDVKNLHLIYYLLRQRKFSIEGAKNYLKENKKKAEQNIQFIQSLTKLRTFLLELKSNLGA